jgi:hypothetical protein
LVRTSHLLLIIAVVLISCHRSQHPLEFYYFRQTLEFSEAEKRALQENGTTELVVKYFDVAIKDGMAAPVAKLHIKEQPVAGIEVVPLVYITNEVMAAKPATDTAYFRKLAQDVGRLITAISDSNGLTPHSIHLDCDWTLTSRDGYFLFLKLFKQRTNCSTITTLRLHQIKYYRETGIPPSDGYVLMLYNFGKISSGGTNSIFSPQSYRPYLESLHGYPKSYSLALPIFGWWVWSRYGKVMNLIPATTLQRKQLASFAAKIKSNTFSVKKKTIYSNFIFRTGDLLRIEQPDMRQVIDAIKEIKNNTKYPIPSIYIYELQEAYLENYRNTTLQELQETLSD